MTSQPRPDRATVTGSYDRGVDAYDALWSPVILPPARVVVHALRLRSGDRVVDVGAGTGALAPVLRAAVGSASRVVALDASRGMLRVARSVHGVAATQADAEALPIADGSADAVLLSFVLFHLNDPARGVAEAARVLCRGGRVGTVTWAREGSFKAGAESDSVLADGGVPTLPVRRVDTGLDSPTGVEALLLGGGLRPERAWTEQLHHRWERSTFWRLVTGSGVNRTRLALVDATTRRAVLMRLRKRLDDLEADDYVWSGEVVCAIGTNQAQSSTGSQKAWGSLTVVGVEWSHGPRVRGHTTPYPAPRADRDEVAVTGGVLDIHCCGPSRLTVPVNEAGLPAVAFPVGTSHQDLPIGAQLIGPARSDEHLLASVAEHQDAWQTDVLDFTG